MLGTDVEDEMMLVTVNAIWSPISAIFLHERRAPTSNGVTNIKILPPTSKNCHQLQVTNIAVTKFIFYYSGRKSSNPKNWSFYRALIWIFEEQDVDQTTSNIHTQ